MPAQHGTGIKERVFIWRKHKMDLKHMEYFVTSADLGSFSKAAEALEVTQPQVSKWCMVWRRNWA